jgi:DUF4097 and DUF4098 domain-containing protein YvlB
MNKEMFLSFILPVLAVLTFVTVRQVRGENEMNYNERGTIHMKRAKDSFKNINVNVMFHKVEIIDTEDSVSSYEINGRNNSKIFHEIKDDTLKITYNFSLYNYICDMMYGINKFNIKIFVPKNTQCHMIRMRNTSGTLDIKKIMCKTFDLQTTSGAISIAAGNIENFKAKQTSGRLNFDGCMIGTADIKSTSGNLDIKSTKMQGLKRSTTSGNTVFSGVLTGKTDIKSTSGSINLTIESKKENYNIFIDITSGSIFLDGQKTKKNKDRLYYKSEIGQNDLMLKSTSGSVKIMFK